MKKGKYKQLSNAISIKKLNKNIKKMVKIPGIRKQCRK